MTRSVGLADLFRQYPEAEDDECVGQRSVQQGAGKCGGQPPHLPLSREAIALAVLPTV